MRVGNQAALQELAERIAQADAVVIGGGSGLSSAAGYDHYHWSPALSEALAPFREQYGFPSPLAGFSKILFLELGVGRMTPMFIQEPFWNLTLSFLHARYIAINNKYDFLPKQLEDKGMTIVADIAQVLRDARKL